MDEHTKQAQADEAGDRRGAPVSHAEIIAAAVRYLHDSTSGRWDQAEPFVADNVRFVFPGAEFASLAAMRDGLVRRYTGMEKHIDTTDVASASDSTVIIVSGTLSGTNLHGVPFQGVRFLDRLVIRDGLLVEQHVFNDLAISGVLDRHN